MTAPTDLPAPAARACEAFLDAADFMAPDLVEGLYLRGSLLWGEFFPGSDVDATVLLSRRPDANDRAALAAAHAQVRALLPEVMLEGHHLTRAQLTGWPSDVGPVPVVHGGELLDAHDLDVNLVTWHELAERGHTVAGPRVTDLGIPTDDAALREYTSRNLRTYWRAAHARLLADPDAAAREDVAAWCVLGVSRLVHLLVTGELAPKSGAGRWALTDFGAAHGRVVAEALRARETPQATGDYAGAPQQRAADVVAYLEAAFARSDEVCPPPPAPADPEEPAPGA